MSVGMAVALNVISNLVIVLGYTLVPVTWLPYLPLTKPVLLSGVVFFVTCAITHAATAFGIPHGNGWMLLNHVVQAIAVILFVLGFSRLLKKADEVRRNGEVPNHDA